jgi:sugar lactone lactonase YvrE
LSKTTNVASYMNGNNYFVDVGGGQVRKIEMANHPGDKMSESEAAGKGGDDELAVDAHLYGSQRLAFDQSDNLYITESKGNRVRKVDHLGKIVTVAGSGSPGYSGDNSPANEAQLYDPHGITFDGDENFFVVDARNNCIRKVDHITGEISTIAGKGDYGYGGDNGPAINATLFHPQGAVTDGNGDLYIADTYNHRIRKWDKTTGFITTIAGDGSAGYNGDNVNAIDAKLSFPTDIVLDNEGNLYVVDSGNNRIVKINSLGRLSTVVHDRFLGDHRGSEIIPLGNLAIDHEGDLYYVGPGDEIVHKVDHKTGMINAVAGGGEQGDEVSATSTYLDGPNGLAIDSKGNLYIAAIGEHGGIVRKVDHATGRITTIVGKWRSRQLVILL